MKVVRSFSQGGPVLYVCSTPIGNLGDVSLRLLETLKEVDVIAAEDTRHVRKLLTRYEITTKRLMSCHEHNELERDSEFLRIWADGKSVALVSDAGTPIVSDPGQHVVALAIARGIPVVPIPGPSAVLAALVASGLPVQPFTFIGFLPREKRDIIRELDVYANLPTTLIFYEAPHRLKNTLTIFRDYFTSRNVTIAKELTKKHETFIYGTLEECIEYIAEEDVRGEFVVIIGPPDVNVERPIADAQADLESAVQQVFRYMEAGMSHKGAVQEVSLLTNVKKKDLYPRTLIRNEK